MCVAEVLHGSVRFISGVGKEEGGWGRGRGGCHKPLRGEEEKEGRKEEEVEGEEREGSARRT